ncbi:MAG: SAP domain-containing protein [Clostridia bacterium]|nr:SAP domain-containing protein [Clostridia bacterium]
MVMHLTRREALRRMVHAGKDLWQLEDCHKDNDTIVKAAIKSGGSLMHASIRLQNDEECIVLAAQRAEIWEIDLDTAIYCAIHDQDLRTRFAPYYADSDEYQIALKIHCGSEYRSSIEMYNTLPQESLASAMKMYRRAKVREARKAYVKGCSTEQISEDEKLASSFRSTPLLWEAVELRERGEAFASIANIFHHLLDQERTKIEKYCSRQIPGSFPERIIASLLMQLKVDFVREKTFNWSKRVVNAEGKEEAKRYDFYIPALSTIIEVHGAQHYGESFESMGGRTYEEEQRNDRQKEYIARENGIQHYVVINALSPTLEFIKKSVLQSREMASLFDLTCIDWDAVERGTRVNIPTNMRFELSDLRMQRWNDWLDAIRCELRVGDNVPLMAATPKFMSSDSAELLENLRFAIPTRNGLYPHELLMLKESIYYRYPLEKKRIPDKWRYEFGIGDVRKNFDKLIRDGFLQVGDIKNSLEHLSVSELKRMLAERELPIHGNKSELVSIVLMHIPHYELEKAATEKWLKLTELGQRELNENEYVFYYKKCRVSLWTLNRLAYAFPNVNMEQLLEKVENNPVAYRRFFAPCDINKY